MFELNQEIEKWKDHLLHTKSLKEDDVQEIKSHLIDSVDALTQSGLSEEEAFFVAKHRVGDVDALNSEYAKVNKGHVWLRRFIWLITGYFLFGSVPIAIQITSQLIHSFNIESLLYPSTLLWGHSYSAPYPVFAIALLIVGLSMYFLIREKDSSIDKFVALQSRSKVIFGILASYAMLAMVQIFGWQFINTNPELK
ncbi:MAG: permease prefix domain 1-containing protein [Chloroflexota bacterium]